ncbi:hypothetical protein SCP_1201350 [Sparassis crispa]|uniref:Uncharacterized protein n=1 Tax=Sparassis crispa TaxID=139825 RepID=A0A401H0J6_9APHY|nr:hypothetical protein SCP_1201350 [Sparassis crispa]GBE87910.1 hypothetical protein SCP_1201350 [Sparassis crispa]
MAKNAEKNNEKLFPIFRKNLAEGGIGAYTATAEKLALWLSKDKAYYPQARPIIVDLLEAAYSAVRRKNEKGLMSYHVSKAPDLYVAPFMKMVRTMSPFYAFFSEEKLQARLRPLLLCAGLNPDELVSRSRTASGSSVIPVDASLTPAPADKTTPVRVSPTNVQMDIFSVPTNVSPVPVDASPAPANVPPAFASVHGTLTPTPVNATLKIKPKLRKRFALNYLQADLEEYDEHRMDSSCASSSREQVGKATPEPVTEPAKQSGRSASATTTSPTSERGGAAAINEPRDVTMAERCSTPTATVSVATASSPLEAVQTKSASAETVDSGGPQVKSDVQVSPTWPASPEVPVTSPGTATGVSNVGTLTTAMMNTSTESDGPTPTQSSPAREILQPSTAPATVSPRRAFRMGKKPRRGPPGFKTLPVLVQNPNGTVTAVGHTGPPGASASPSKSPVAPGSPSAEVQAADGLPDKQRKGKQRASEPLGTLPPPGHAERNEPTTTDTESHRRAPTLLLPFGGVGTSSRVELPALLESEMDISQSVSVDRSRHVSEQPVKHAEVTENPLTVKSSDPNVEATLEWNEQSMEMDVAPSTVPEPTAETPQGTAGAAGEESMTSAVLGPSAGVASSDEKASVDGSQTQPDGVVGAAEDNSPQVHHKSDADDISHMGVDVYHRPAEPFAVARSLETVAIAATDGAAGDARDVTAEGAHADAQPDEQGSSPSDEQVISRNGTDKSTSSKAASTAKIQAEASPGVAGSSEPTIRDIPTEGMEYISVPGTTPILHAGLNGTPAPYVPGDAVATAHVETTKQAGVLARRKRPRSPSACASDVERPRRKSRTISPVRSVAAEPSALGGNELSADATSYSIATTAMDVDHKTVTIPDELALSNGDVEPAEAVREDAHVQAIVPSGRQDSAMSLEKREVRPTAKPEESSSISIPPAIAKMMDEVPSHSPENAAPVFDSTSNVIVLNCSRGSSPRNLNLEFQIDGEEAAELSRWKGRYQTKDDVSTTKCLSLTCYQFSEHLAPIGGDSVPNFEQMVVGATPSLWPRDGRLWAELDNGVTRKSLPLSPPFMLRSDFLIDLSGLAKPGKNTLCLHQLGDYSDYVFVLHLHSPTAHQLAELKQRRDRDEEWYSYLRSFRNILELPRFRWPDEISPTTT